MIATPKVTIVVPFENPLTRKNIGWWLHDRLVVPNREWRNFHRYVEDQGYAQLLSEEAGQPATVSRKTQEVRHKYDFFLETDRATIDEIHAVEPEWIPWTELVWGCSVAVSDEHPPPRFRPSQIPKERWDVLMGWCNGTKMGRWTTSGLTQDTWRRYHFLAARPLAGLKAVDPYARKEPGLKIWRKMVIDRDGHRCTSCGANERLEAHHISPYVIDEARRLDLSNGQTLCRTCHQHVHRHRT